MIEDSSVVAGLRSFGDDGGVGGGDGGDFAEMFASGVGDNPSFTTGRAEASTTHSSELGIDETPGSGGGGGGAGGGVGNRSAEATTTTPAGATTGNEETGSFIGAATTTNSGGVSTTTTPNAAGEGIRGDAGESVLASSRANDMRAENGASPVAGLVETDPQPVSYTHLTLPTILLV